MEEQGYELKSDKHPAVKGTGQKRFIREFDLLIDIQEKMRQGKGGGYTKWATVYNIKQMAQTLLLLQERDIRDYEVLAEKASGASARFHELSQEIKAAREAFNELPEKKIPKIKDLNVEYAEILKRKKELHSEYRQSKKEVQDFVTAKHNIDSFLRMQEAETSAEKSRSKEKENKKNTER